MNIQFVERLKVWGLHLLSVHTHGTISIVWCYFLYPILLSEPFIATFIFCFL